jgi:NAD(P)-dependent dehydrogenase (short-subunit alcohol dehydrogenase family)
MGPILDGMTAVVIGGSSGIGNQIAHGLQDQGATVAIAARTPGRLEDAANRLRETNPSSRGYICDATKADDLARLVDSATADLGPIDILVTCQGLTILKPAEDFTEEDYDTVMDTNMRSVFFACTAFGRPMLARGRGSIINIASLAAHRGWPRAAVYAVSKHGVAGLTQTLAAEWADRGVRVNAISPGFFMTELNQGKMSAERKENALRRTPMGRFGRLDELVSAAVFLASPGSSFVTGTIVNVDGGYLASGL